MKRASLSALEPEDLIAVILAHPQAGRHVASLLEGSTTDGSLASHTVVYQGRTVCLRTPGTANGTPDVSFHLLLWHEDHIHPWRVDALRVPRDSAELRLLAMAVASAQRTVLVPPSEPSENKAA